MRNEMKRIKYKDNKDCNSIQRHCTVNMCLLHVHKLYDPWKGESISLYSKVYGAKIINGTANNARIIGLS